MTNSELLRFYFESMFAKDDSIDFEVIDLLSMEKWRRESVARSYRWNTRNCMSCRDKERS